MSRQPIGRAGTDYEIIEHYERADEAGRLFSGVGQLELARMQELLVRNMPSPPATVLDVGGGPGAYSLWLSGLGYAVHLTDPVSKHVEQARLAAEQQPDSPIDHISLGDARCLDEDDASADVVLLMGPLYHLTDRPDRIAALCEAYRVLRPGGLAILVGIGRFASALDGLVCGHLADDELARIVERDLATGQHRNPTGHFAYFTTAYFHEPDELRAEALESGFRCEATVAVEGPAWLLHDFEQQWNDPTHRSRILRTIRVVELEPSLLGVSAHVMVAARKPD